MNKSINPATGQPYKIVWFGDMVGLSGFGRIGNEVTKRLSQRGYVVQGAAINYTGWPVRHNLDHIWPLGGQDMWNGLVNIVNSFQPDLIISCQDFPYHQTIWNGCKIDFSKVKWVFITPIDGTPIHPDWVKICDFADGRMVISKFGVEALRQVGKRVDLCHPGVDVGEFFPATAEDKKSLREAAGYSESDYIVGSMCMNQGRKAIPPMIAAFHEFAKDKPEAKLMLDMDSVSPAGWDIPSLLTQMGWTDEEKKRVKYRQDLFVKDGKQNEEMLPLRNRYCLLDTHMVISHREGFGLPLMESMACGIPTMALDWCSGTEIVGEGRGYVVKKIEYMENGTWGGAKDAFPDMTNLVEGLNYFYQNKESASAIAKKGLEWAAKNTWDVSADQVEAVIQTALSRSRTEKPKHDSNFVVPTPGGNLSDTVGRVGKTPDPVSDNPIVQQPQESVTVPELPNGDGARGGEGGAA